MVFLNTNLTLSFMSVLLQVTKILKQFMQKHFMVNLVTFGVKTSNPWKTWNYNLGFPCLTNYELCFSSRRSEVEKEMFET